MQKLFDAFKQYITSTKRGEKAYRPSAVQYDSMKMEGIMHDLPVKDLDCSEEEMLKVVDFLKISDVFHDYCKEFHSFLLSKLKTLNMRGEDVIELFNAALNRDFKVVTTKIQEAQNKQKGNGLTLFQDMTNPRIMTQEGYGIEVKSGMEGRTDGLNQICNIIRHVMSDDFKDEVATPEKFSENLIHIFIEANKFEAFKYSYDDILYNRGYVKHNFGADSYAFDYDSHRELKLLKAGHMIFQERISKYFQMNLIHHKATPFDKYVAFYRVKRVKLEGGFVKVEFGGGDPKDHREVASEFQAAMEAYYEFLDLNMQLNGVVTLSLIEVLSVWSALRYLCREVLERVNCDLMMNTREEMEAIPRRFKKDDLIQYVSKLTGVKPYRAKTALEFFEVNWATINDVWTVPLYNVGDYYSIPFYPVVNCVHYNIIEHILERGGHSLDERGSIFEKYLFDEIDKFQHGYYVKCLGSQNYAINKDKEEIDMIVALRDLIILVEAKCIRYSMDPEDYHNAWQRLEHGAEQAKRKVEFMKRHPELFSELGDISTRKILPIVVTNYPVFTGFEHEGVYVIDAHSFVAYINVGNMTIREMSKDSTHIVGETRFYNNETEYSANFEQYLKENPVKKIYMDKMTIEDIPLVSLEKPWRFSTKTAVYKSNPGFDITNSITAN